MDRIGHELFSAIEQALPRKEGKELLWSLATPFIEHICKCFLFPSSASVAHWYSELTSWLYTVSIIKFKGNKKTISNDFLYACFFTMAVNNAQELEHIATQVLTDSLFGEHACLTRDWQQAWTSYTKFIGEFLKNQPNNTKSTILDLLDKYIK